MDKVMHLVNGINVVTSDLMSIKETTANKKLLLKGWMKGTCYYKRVSKKWLKRYGSTTGRTFLRAGNTIYCHPANYNFLMEAIK